jgi:hypothetical protein
MVTDALDPVGIYFGTRSGKLYASRDAGKSWKELLNGLPQIVCVASAVVAELAGPGHPTLSPEGRRKQEKPSLPGEGRVRGKGTVTKRKATRFKKGTGSGRQR